MKKREIMTSSTPKELKFDFVQDIIDYIDNHNDRKEKRGTLVINGNEIDVLRLVKHYKLKYPNQSYKNCNYRLFRACMMPPKNSFIIGPSSMYGNVITRFNIKDWIVEVRFNLKSSYEHNFASIMAKELTKETEYVVLDIETTGLNPVTDDIIQIGILKNENEYYSRYLPLEKKETNTAFAINRISDACLKNSTPLTQAEVDEIIEKFDLKNKVVAIWTGKNLFDRLFLEAYFLEHDLKGLENIKFFNAKVLLDKYVELNLSYSPKDYIASLYQISVKNAHNAISDCIIEYTIIENLLFGNISPLLETPYNKYLAAIKEYFSSRYKAKYKAKILYDKFCETLIYKNGPVLNDYDCEHLTRGQEWIDIHHVDEKTIDDIATRTNLALAIGDKDVLDSLKPYNRRERLVYANKVEHFILHCLIEIFREGISGGPHWTFGDIIKMQIGFFEKGTKEYEIQQSQETFYSSISLEEVVKIYTFILKMNNLDLDSCINNFYKLKDYNYDEEKLSNFKNKINKCIAKKNN